MKVDIFLNILGCSFYTGVPDSKLKALCDFLQDKYPHNPQRHLIAANEGNAVAAAAGCYLASGKPALVYLQNSGEGNMVNPIASLCNKRVYGIPMTLVIGWRGEPGLHDEPQHAFQGIITENLLDCLEIPHMTLTASTSPDEVAAQWASFQHNLAEGQQVAFLVRQNALTWDQKYAYQNDYSLRREDAVRCIAESCGSSLIVSTTGKASRELFEIRETLGEGHHKDFLTVGSMGHASSIALGIALQQPNQKIIVLDGDGALIMHMGAMAVIGAAAPRNLIHIVLNNNAHESVGGQPTAASTMNLIRIAEGCAYPLRFSVSTLSELENALSYALRENILTFIEVKCAVGARENLGRPTNSPMDNKELFMNNFSR